MDIAKILKSSPAFVLPAVINLVSLVAFTRMLSLADYGHLSLALVSIEFLQGILFGWINMCVMRFYNPDDRPLAISVGLQYSLLTCGLIVLAVIIIGLIGVFSQALDTWFFILILLGVVGRGISYFLQDVYRMYRLDLKSYTIVTFMANAWYYIPAIVYLFFNRQASINTLLALQVGGIFTLLTLLLLLKRKITWTYLHNKLPKAIYMDFLKYGLPLIISFISISVFVRIERYVIQYTAGAEDLGRYSAAFTLSNLAISSFFTILTLPTYPVIMRLLNEGNMQEARSIYKRNGQLILIIGLVAVSLCFLLNQPLCRLFFGPDKGEQISGLFPWVVVSTFLFNYRVHYSEQLFQFNKETKKAMYLGLIIGGAHFVIGYLLSNAFGARGVSYSGILTNSLLIAYIIYYSRTVLAKKPMAFT